MKHAGVALFAIGILIGISGGAKMPAESQRWPDTIGIFLTGAIMAAIGVVLWRMDIRKQLRDGIRVVATDDKANPTPLLEHAVTPVEALSKELDSLSEKQLMERIDTILESYILPFAEARRSVIDRFGMGQGADILVTVAFAERMFNRVWSAASDGNIEEARASFRDAADALAEARRLMQRRQADA